MVHYFNFIVFYINFEFSPITPGVVAPHIEIEPVDVGEGGDGQEVAQYEENDSSGTRIGKQFLINVV